MNKLLKRLLILALCCSMILGTALQSLGEVGGLSAGGSITPSSDYKGKGTATQGVTKGWGIRVTFGIGSSLLEKGITDLPANPTQADLDAQFTAVRGIADKTYVEPGVGGINYYTGTSPLYGVGSAVDMLKTDLAGTKQPLKTVSDSNVNMYTNTLAWKCYYTGDAESYRNTFTGDPTKISFDQTLYDIVFGTQSASAAGDPGVWLDGIKRQFYPTQGKASDSKASEDLLSTIIVLPGTYINDNIAKFTWTSVSDVSAMGDVSQKVKWSKLGYVTALMQVAWAAQEIGEQKTYEDMANKIAAWARACLKNKICIKHMFLYPFS